jgi:hypothetical protein
MPCNARRQKRDVKDLISDCNTVHESSFYLQSSFTGVFLSGYYVSLVMPNPVITLSQIAFVRAKQGRSTTREYLHTYGRTYSPAIIVLAARGTNKQSINDR